MEKTIKEKAVIDEGIVYKYRDCENEFHRRILLKNEIYFASPKSFNDPFDCRIDYNFSSLTGTEKQDYINDQIQFSKEESQMRGYSFDEKEERKKLEKVFIDNNELLSRQDKYNEQNFNNLNDNIGVFSCCQNIKHKRSWKNLLLYPCLVTPKKNLEGWQNTLLWSHYANDHKGFCVGLDKLRLNSFLKLKGKSEMQNGVVYSGGPVNYDKYLDLKPVTPISKNREIIKNNFIREISYKSNVWEYENELRFIKLQTKIDAGGLSDEDRKISLPPNVIVEVTLGVCIDDWHKNAIKRICRSKGIKLYQVVKKPFEFSIGRVSLDI